MRSARKPEDVFDELLVLKIQHGDAAALDLLARRWNQRVLRHAGRLTGDLEGAAEVAQEAWVAVVRNVRRLRDPAAFRGWIYRITSNKATDWIRRRQHGRALTAKAARESEAHDAHNVHDAGESPDQNEDVARLRTAVADLPADRRALLSMYYLEGLTIGEIARALAIPAGTVKSRLFHARNQLRSRL